MYQFLHFDEKYRKVIRELISSGQFKINASGKLEPADPKGILNSPWIFIGPRARRKHCQIWNAIYCGKFGIIPRVCRFYCWKTVIKPRNVLELFKLVDVLTLLNLPSKCGADRRNYTYGAWAGFVYADSLEEGKEYYRQVRKAVDKAISPEVEVILKRGCTEMEMLKPSNQWDNWPEEERQLEWQLDDLFCLNEINFSQSQWLINDIKEGWILRAIEIGDPTARQALELYSGQKDLWDKIVSHPITYHDKEE